MKLEKRMHPLEMIQSLFSMVKNNAIFILYLFVIRLKDTSVILKYGRIAFLIILVIQIIAFVIRWFYTTYEIKEQQIHFYRGLFKKRHNRISLLNVQNIQRSTPFYFKPFQVTSLHLITSATDDRASIQFPAISVEEANKIESLLENVKETADSVVEEGLPEALSLEDHSFEETEMQGQRGGDHASNIEQKDDMEKREVIFEPSRKELLRASILSLSFLIVIPILITFYENIKDVIAFEEQLANIFNKITSSWLLIGISFLVMIILLIGLGIGWTFFHYGKYKISEDHKHIYVKMGVMSERFLSIKKANVQAIHMIQTPIKKWLRLLEIKLISAEDIREEETVKISSLYPYMDKKRAYEMMEDLLPTFQLQKHLHHLPKRSLWMKFLRIPFILIILLCFLLIFQRSFWFIPVLLILFSYLMKFFDYRNTRYIIQGEHIQFKQGGLWSTTYITNREKIVEIEITRSFLQKRLNLATITVINQTKPVHHERIEDVPEFFARQMIHWYLEKEKNFN